MKKRERWRAVVGFPGYKVSDKGRVRSYWKRGVRPLALVQRFELLKDSKATPTGHRHVVLYHEQCRNDFKVHHLVLRAFGRKQRPGEQCRHLDGNPRNNQLDNLCWGTAKENVADSIRHGTHIKGERCYLSKLKRQSVMQIYAALLSGSKTGDLAKKYRVGVNTIQRIANGSLWAWLTKQKRVFRGSAGLKPSDVVKICRALNNGETSRSIGKRFKVTEGAISQIKLGKHWSWLTGLKRRVSSCRKH